MVLTAGQEQHVDADGLVAISSRETAIKVKNLRRDPYASLCVVNDGFYGEWMQIEGTASILSLPDALPGHLGAGHRQPGAPAFLAGGVTARTASLRAGAMPSAASTAAIH